MTPIPKQTWKSQSFSYLACLVCNIAWMIMQLSFVICTRSHGSLQLWDPSWSGTGPWSSVSLGQKKGHFFGGGHAGVIFGGVSGSFLGVIFGELLFIFGSSGLFSSSGTCKIRSVTSRCTIRTHFRRNSNLGKPLRGRFLFLRSWPLPLNYSCS